MSRDFIADDFEFQSKYGFYNNVMTKDYLKFRLGFIEEEFWEMWKAFDDEDSEELVDAWVDLMVVILGTMSQAGVDIEKAWNEVFKANMTKERGIKKGRENSGGLDLIKPSGWKKPSHKNNHGILPRVFTEAKEDDKV